MNKNKKQWYPAVAKANIGAKRKSTKPKVAASGNKTSHHDQEKRD